MRSRLLGVFDGETAGQFLALGRTVRHAAGDPLCREGEPADSFHLLQAGWVAVRLSLADGSTSTLNILGPGDYFGELSLIRPEGRRTATVVALEDVESIAIPARAFRDACAADPALTRAIAIVLADRVDLLSHRVAEASYADLGTRVRSRLAELGSRRRSLPLTQTELAQMVGGSRQAVNQVLQELAGRGLVALSRGRVDVLDVAALAVAD